MNIKQVELYLSLKAMASSIGIPNSIGKKLEFRLSGKEFKAAHELSVSRNLNRVFEQSVVEKIGDESNCVFSYPMFFHINYAGIESIRGRISVDNEPLDLFDMTPEPFLAL